MQQPSLLQIFAKISDPRVNRCKKHNLLDIIILSILGVLCGADTYGEIEMFGKANSGVSQTVFVVDKRHSLARYHQPCFSSYQSPSA
jgi:hypothetical protein